MKDPKIIDRIRALLNMAGDAASPHEAAIAAGRARKLMDMHQVSLEDLGDKSTGFAVRAIDKEYRFLPKWKDMLCVAVAKFNDCKAVRTHKWKSINNSYSVQLAIQGYESDVEVGAAMYDYLSSTIDRLCSRYIVSLGYDRYPAKIGDAYKRSAAITLANRLQAMSDERKADIKLSDGRSLVLVKMAAVEAEFGEAKYTQIKARPIKDQATLDAVSQGREDARKIAINPMVKGPEQRKAIQ